jgi:molybdate transport system substrate-binding protein
MTMTARGPRRRLGPPARPRALAALATLVAAVLVLGGLASACGPQPRPQEAQSREHQPLRVLAAASLTDVVEAIASDLAEPVETSFAGTSALVRQIRDGAPADVLLSASREWVELLRDDDLVAGDPDIVARNRLVAIAPRGSALAGRVRDPASLLGALSEPGTAGRVGIADEGVPAGEYARSALERQGLLPALGGRLVGQSDVRAVLVAVARGDLDAGFVYATDARAGDVEVLFTFDRATHPSIEILAVALRGAASPERARRFVESLRGPQAQARLRAAGFEAP